MPRYVVLFHAMPTNSKREDHWDFMLEDGDALMTWALPRQPDEQHDEQPSHPIPCSQLPDHRLRYLDYQGPVSKDRGEVTRWDRGSFEFLTKDSQAVSAILNGHRLRGTVQLTAEQGIWLFRFTPQQT